MRRVIQTCVDVLLWGVVAIAACLIISTVITGKTSIFGYRPMVVATNSMEPELPVGTFVLLEVVKPEEISVGDICGYWKGNKFIGINPIILHRVIEISEDGYYFKGDNNETVDPIVPENHVLYRLKIIF